MKGIFMVLECSCRPLYVHIVVQCVGEVYYISLLRNSRNPFVLKIVLPTVNAVIFFISYLCYELKR